MFVPFFRKAEFSQNYFLHPLVLSYWPELARVGHPSCKGAWEVRDHDELSPRLGTWDPARNQGSRGEKEQADSYWETANKSWLHPGT